MPSRYSHAVPAILAEMERQRQENGNPSQPDQEGEAVEKMFVYRTDTGGWLISPTKIGGQEPPIEEDGQQAPAPIVDANEPEPAAQPTVRREPPYFLHFLLILFLFVGLDSLDTVFAQFAPTVTVTITPVVKTISAAATLTVGSAGTEGNGRVLAPLTLSQEQTAPVTGRGHQDAGRATGTLIYFNGSFAPQTVDAGTVYTGADGVQVATNATITIPAATPGNPPRFGQGAVTAHAILAGAGGNIRAGDITVTGSALQVSNNPFSGGQDARDFSYVTKADIQGVVSVLTPRLLQSEQAALTAQLTNAESLAAPACTPGVNANHHAGEEAGSVTVTVSETCNAVAYNPKALESAAVRILTAQEMKQLGSGYRLYGQVQVSVTKVTTTPKSATLFFSTRGTWIYQLNETHVKALVMGKPRLSALHSLSVLPGVQTARIAGVGDNAQLPTDPAYIHILIIAEVWRIGATSPPSAGWTRRIM